jgi:ankyrin repeat protein
MATLKTALFSLPPTLEETYDRILHQIADQEKSRVRHVLQFLCFALRPIRLTELAEVYRIGDCVSIQLPFTHESTLFNLEDIIDICQGLLTLEVMAGNKFSSSGLHYHQTKEESITIIQLAHFSVKEFLLSHCSSFWKVTEEASHVSIIRTSIASFLQVTITIDAPVDHLYHCNVIDTLATYFSLYLSHHLDMLHPREHPTLIPSFQVLFDNRLSYSNRIMELWCSLGITCRACTIEKLSMAPNRILFFAAFLGLTGTLQWLLTSGRVLLSAINGTHHPCAPMVAAVCSGCTDTVQCLIDLGANLDSVAADFNATAIYTASRYGYADIVQLLVDAGAKVNHDDFGESALSLASDKGHEAIVRILLKAGADVSGEPRARGNLTPIALASFRGHTRIVRMLIEAGADARLDYRDEEPTPLWMAASKGYTEIVQILIDAGVDVDYRRGRFDFETPLQTAVYSRHTEIVQILLEAGADPNASHNGWRRNDPPLVIANELGETDIANLLVRYGAHPDAPQRDTYVCDNLGSQRDP